MTHGVGKYIGTNANGYGYARVHLQCDDVLAQFCVRVVLDESDANDQLRGGEFVDWTDAAMEGVRHALRMRGDERGNWTVVRVVGQLCDTIPRYTAYAAAIATWDALGYHASDKEKDALYQWVVGTFDAWPEPDGG